MKKKGFGVCLWNGAGGKLESGENVEAAARREVQEEFGIHVIGAEKAALLHFYFPDDPEKANWNQDVHVFLARKWTGVPKEGSEMRPHWFSIYQLPYLTMWADDKYWLQRVLDGEKLEGWFVFDDKDGVSDYEVKNVEDGGNILAQR